jgi:hypothetical protein
MRAFACIVLALPVLIVPTVADAQQQRAAKMTNDQVIAARRECFAEAKVRAPGSDWTGAGLQSLRENAYRDCAARKGIRP